MTNEELQRMRDHLHDLISIPPGKAGERVLFDHLRSRTEQVAVLLAEVERLRAETAQQPVAQTVAQTVAQSMLSHVQEVVGVRVLPFCAWDVDVTIQRSGHKATLRVFATNKAQAEEFAESACAQNGTPARVGSWTRLWWGDEDKEHEHARHD